MDKHIATLEAIRANGFDFGFENEEYAALDAAIALMRGQSWKPIETAPKDGRTRILLAGQQDVFLGVRPIGCPDDAAADDLGIACYPTHWQPLPAPPKDTADEQ